MYASSEAPYISALRIRARVLPRSLFPLAVVLVTSTNWSTVAATRL